MHWEFVVNYNDLEDLRSNLADVVDHGKAYAAIDARPRFGEQKHHFLVIFADFVYSYNLLGIGKTQEHLIYYSRFYNYREERKRLLDAGELPDQSKYKFMKVRTTDFYRIVCTVCDIGEIWKSEQNLGNQIR